MNDNEHQIATSVLVIGTGGAGLRAAVELAERGVDVLAVGKRPKSDAHTTLAAGGINVALGSMDPEDSWQQHAADTLEESYLLADPETVRIVTENVVWGIEDFECYGMFFAREVDGKISQRFFGAHTYRRTAFAGDYTGLEIQRTLVNRAAQLDIPILDTVYITRTIMRRLPRVYQTLLELQMLDITREPIEIAPTAHYSMGGVWVCPEDHGTGVAGLYAIGEAASGLHGANRLGGNSLIELLVYGRIVGEAAARYSRDLGAQRRSSSSRPSGFRCAQRDGRSGRCHGSVGRPSARRGARSAT